MSPRDTQLYHRTVARADHGLPGPYECPCCGLLFTTPFARDRHLRRVRALEDPQHKEPAHARKS